MNQTRSKSNKNSGGNSTSKTDDAKYTYDGHPLGYATFKDNKAKAKLRDTDSLGLPIGKVDSNKQKLGRPCSPPQYSILNTEC